MLDLFFNFCFPFLERSLTLCANFWQKKTYLLDSLSVISVLNTTFTYEFLFTLVKKMLGNKHKFQKQCRIILFFFFLKKKLRNGKLEALSIGPFIIVVTSIRLKTSIFDHTYTFFISFRGLIRLKLIWKPCIPFWLNVVSWNRSWSLILFNLPTILAQKLMFR